MTAADVLHGGLLPSITRDDLYIPVIVVVVDRRILVNYRAVLRSESKEKPWSEWEDCSGWTVSVLSNIFASTNMLTKDSMTRIDQIFRAFADRNRLRILHLLLGGELCVGDIVQILDVPQPRVSRHLAYLRKAGLVNVRKEGLWSFYSLAPPANEFHGNLLTCLQCCFADVPELKMDAKRAGRVRESGGCCAR
jgi:ArsR family transcriptional regulator, arsenate/arsenite/antimonite-responsive transcriptional repressor